MGKTKPKYRLSGVCDQGILLSRDKPGQKLYDVEGGCIRQGMLWKESGLYYLTYDAFPPVNSDDHWVRNCIAQSTDLRTWDKLGVIMEPSMLERPDCALEDTADAVFSGSPWFLRADAGLLYMLYVGSSSPGIVPGIPYTALVAVSERFIGPWHKINAEPGKNKHVIFPLKKNSFYDETACSGFTWQNPKWQGEDDTVNAKFVMYFSGCTHSDENGYRRAIGIARTNNLTQTDDYDNPNGHFWQIDEHPIIPLEDDVENTSIYFEPTNQTYFLFTNHIDETNSYTDAVWVYWSKDPDNWNPEHKAAVLDKQNCMNTTGAIGMPSVLKIDDNTLAMTYDAAPECDISHLNRDICWATIKLPLVPPSEE